MSLILRCLQRLRTCSYWYPVRLRRGSSLSSLIPQDSHAMPTHLPAFYGSEINVGKKRSIHNAFPLSSSFSSEPISAGFAGSNWRESLINESNTLLSSLISQDSHATLPLFPTPGWLRNKRGNGNERIHNLLHRSTLSRLQAGFSVGAAWESRQ